MGYKKYSDSSSADAMMNNIESGKISNSNTAYRELKSISNEYRGSSIGNRADDMIDDLYCGQKYDSGNDNDNDND